MRTINRKASDISEMQATQFANFDYFSSVFFSTFKNGTARDPQYEARSALNIEEAERRMKPYWIGIWGGKIYLLNILVLLLRV